MTAKKVTPKEPEVSEILRVETGTLQCHLIGESPLILNRMSQKALHELLYPRGRKTAVEKLSNLKHDPVTEYRAAPYTIKDDASPTLLAHLATAFKGALRTAALDMPGAKKAQIGRLTYINGELIGIYGIPKLLMSVTRSADMNKTPDVRTRVIVPRWACQLSVTFVKPLIRHQAVVNLLGAAGVYVGVGDWRSEKGAGNYGQFRVVDQHDPAYLAIVAEGGRADQIEAMEHPVAYDDETTELLSWFEDERKLRALRGVA